MKRLKNIAVGEIVQIQNKGSFRKLSLNKYPTYHVKIDIKLIPVLSLNDDTLDFFHEDTLTTKV